MSDEREDRFLWGAGDLTTSSEPHEETENERFIREAREEREAQES